LKLKHTACALNGVLSENTTPLRSLNVQLSPFLLAVHDVASSGMIFVPPSLKPTRLSKI